MSGSLRHYYRCVDCLTVAATSEPLQVQRVEGWINSYGECGACGGRIESMGQVYQERLVKPELRTPCDCRCTGARGPNCDCRCGGANHGTGLMVEVMVGAGPVPRLMTPAGGRWRAEEYRALRDAFLEHWHARYDVVVDTKRSGGYLSPDQFRHYCVGTGFMREFHEVKGMRTHKGRVQKLEKLLERSGGKLPAAVLSLAALGPLFAGVMA